MTSAALADPWELEDEDPDLFEEDDTMEERKIVWVPLWGSQSDALICPAQEILYHGTRGPGKTDVQLMRFRARVGLGYGAHWRGIILDLEYKNLDDIVQKSLRWFPQFNDGAKFNGSGSGYKWTWPTGEELLFRQMKDKRDYAKYHGHEYSYIAWNELTKHATPEVYDLMKSCNRSSFIPEEHTPKDRKGRYLTADGNPLPEIPLEYFSTTNPLGVGHSWVHARLVEARRPGEIRVTTTAIFNPRTERMETVETTQCHIFGSYKENKYLSPQYVAGLTNIKDPNRRKAWLEGDWSIISGGAIDDLWNPDVHVMSRFIVPRTWRVDRSFDWGSTAPHATVFWAEANGEEAILANGERFCPPAGSLVAIGEIFGADPVQYESGIVKGVKDTAKVVAQKIKAYERDVLRDPGWISDEVRAGPADNQIRQVVEVDVDTIEKKMADEGVRWTESDKSPGSRKIGLELLRGMLENSVTGDGPGIYFTSNCRFCISTLPLLPRDPDNEDDVDTDSNDHLYDAVRYRVLKGRNRLATMLNLEFPT